MCEQNTTETFKITNADGVEKMIDVDRCIAPIVRALNSAGVVTVASCCGHGKRPGNIALADGREICIMPDFESGRRFDLLFPPVNMLPATRELLCQQCNKDYPVWFAPNELWNAVTDHLEEKPYIQFLCPTCFALLAEEKLGEEFIWKLEKTVGKTEE